MGGDFTDKEIEAILVEAYSQRGGAIWDKEYLARMVLEARAERDEIIKNALSLLGDCNQHTHATFDEFVKGYQCPMCLSAERDALRTKLENTPMKATFREAVDAALTEARDDGYRVGESYGYDEGYAAGWHHGLNEPRNKP